MVIYQLLQKANKSTEYIPYFKSEHISYFKSWLLSECVEYPHVL